MKRRWAVMGCCLGLATATAVGAQETPVRIKQLHDALHLTITQEDAWRDYAAAVAPRPDMEARHRATEQLLPRLPTPRRVALIEATMEQDEADFRRQAEAVKAFYALLTPQQAQTFDRETLPAAPAQPASDGRGPDQGPGPASNDPDAGPPIHSLRAPPPPGD